MSYRYSIDGCEASDEKIKGGGVDGLHRCGDSTWIA